MNILNKIGQVVQKACKTAKRYAVVAVGAVAVGVSTLAHATDPLTGIDATSIVTAVGTPAATTMTWVISISTLVTVFGYVMWLIKKKRG